MPLRLTSLGVAYGLGLMLATAAAANANPRPIFDGVGDAGTRVVLTSRQVVAVSATSRKLLETLAPAVLSQTSVDVVESKNDTYVYYTASGTHVVRTFLVSGNGRVQEGGTNAPSTASSGRLTVSGDHALALYYAVKKFLETQPATALDNYIVIEYRSGSYYFVGFSPKQDPANPKAYLGRAVPCSVEVKTGAVKLLPIPV